MKTFIKPYFFLLLSFILLFCVTSKANNDGTVNISGTSTDMKDNSISIRSINAFFNDGKMNYIASQRNQNGEFSLTFKLNRPALFIFSAFYRNWYVNICPTDSVTFKIIGKDMKQQLEFFGKDAARYNFDVLVSEVIDKERGKNKSQNLTEYKKSLGEWKKNSENLIKLYLSKHKVEKAVANAGRNRVNYHYVKSIYYYTGANMKEAFPPDYFDLADKYAFTSDNSLLLPEYQSAVYYKYIANIPNNQEQPIKFVYQRIQSNLWGKTRDFALSFLTGKYAREGAIKDSLMLRQIFNELYSKKLDTNYLTYLKDNEMRYFVVGKPLPDNVLENTFFTDYVKGQSLSLSQLLYLYKGKAIYFDLWASWCVPCRSDIKTSSEIKMFLADNDVSVVYLSTDRDDWAWKKASEEDQITSHQFRFKTDTENYFAAFIGLEGIPRYIFLDKNHNVSTLYAPRPYSRDKSQFEKLIQEMNSSK